MVANKYIQRGLKSPLTASQLLTNSQIDQLQQDMAYLTTVKEWLENFLGKPNPHLGRSGTVCPFIPRSLQIDAIRLAVVHTSNSDQQQIESLVKHYRDIFLELEAKDGELALYKAILLIFPDVSHEQAPLLIDAVQKKLKSFFVEAGLMIGEFHALNETPGLHNPNFRPLRSPIPILAIRSMVESDLPFLIQPTNESPLQIQYLEAYLKNIGSSFKNQDNFYQAQTTLSQLRDRLGQPTLNLQKPASRCPFFRITETIKTIFRLVT